MSELFGDGSSEGKGNTFQKLVNEQASGNMAAFNANAEVVVWNMAKVATVAGYDLHIPSGDH